MVSNGLFWGGVVLIILGIVGSLVLKRPIGLLLVPVGVACMVAYFLSA